MPHKLKNRFSESRTGEIDRQYNILYQPRFARRVLRDGLFIGAKLSSDNGDFFGATTVIVPDSDRGIISIWWRDSVPIGAREILANATRASVQLPGIDPHSLAQVFKDSAGTNLVVHSSATASGNAGLFPIGTWNHGLMSWCLTSDNLFNHMYVNDLRTASASTLVTGAVDWDDAAGPGIWFGSFVNGAFPISGGLAEIYMNVGHFLDLSVEANRRLFITRGLTAANLGKNGEKPTATQPDIYLRGIGREMATNRGTGGALTTIGGSPQRNLIAVVGNDNTG